MLNNKIIIVFSLVFFLSLLGCSTKVPVIPVDEQSVNPGESVTRGGTTTFNLLGEPIRVGDQLPSIALVDLNLKKVDLSKMRGEVLLLSIVPSLDTNVCERQTHILGEEGSALPAGIRRVTISRDLPFAQQRFADQTGFKDILFLSDFQKADFGKSTGLLIDQLYLLSRSVILVDQQGSVRYIQVVPELSHLPDLTSAFAKAKELLAE